MSVPRLGVISDFPEEGWASMDLVAEMLLENLQGSEEVRASRVCAPFKRRFGFLGGFGRNLDRLTNRMRDYPRYLRGRVGEFDCFHICDHSYSQLVHELPAERTGVFLHDLDTFRCLLEPEKERRPKWFKAMARRILQGLQKARVVFYLTAPIREQVERHGLIDPGRLVQAPVAAAPEFRYLPTDEGEREGRFVLHVGSCIARKRIDVLLEVFARVKDAGVRLVQVGGEFTGEQRELIGRLGIGGRISQRRGLDRGEIARLYRGAAVVLQPSEAEGFGLPVIEALACGATVLASDIPVLREVGGDGALYAPVGDVGRWAEALNGLLEGRVGAPSVESRLGQARRYSWAEHAGVIGRAYRALCAGGVR